jgi:hypothetical protein
MRLIPLAALLVACPVLGLPSPNPGETCGVYVARHERAGWVRNSGSPDLPHLSGKYDGSDARLLLYCDDDTLESVELLISYETEKTAFHEFHRLRRELSDAHETAEPQEPLKEEPAESAPFVSTLRIDSMAELEALHAELAAENPEFAAALATLIEDVPELDETIDKVRAERSKREDEVGADSLDDLPSAEWRTPRHEISLRMSGRHSLWSVDLSYWSIPTGVGPARGVLTELVDPEPTRAE